jgi:hypothetical protein
VRPCGAGIPARPEAQKEKERELSSRPSEFLLFLLLFLEYQMAGGKPANFSKIIFSLLTST